MRVSLQIDGDASGAQKAAQDTSAAVVSLGQQTDDTSKAIEDGFKKASGALDSVKGSAQAAGAANDNVANAAAGFAGKIGQITSAAAGADSALAKATSGAINFGKGVGDLFKTVGTANVLSGALGLAVTAATTFYSVINTGSADAERAHNEQVRLLGIVKDAFSGATEKADEFYKKQADIVRLQASQGLIAAQADLKKQATGLAAGSSYQNTPIFGSDLGAGFGDDGSGAAKVSAFQNAIDNLHASISRGAIDIETYRIEIAKIGNAAQASNPAIAAQAAALLKASEDAARASEDVAKFKAQLTLSDPTSSDADKAKAKSILGIGDAADQASNQFERFIKSIDRQSASMEADAAAVGGSAGQIAKLRAEYVLTEAAQQAGGDTAQKYADKIAQVAARAGDAAQKLAQVKLQSDASFNLSQLGRSTTDASVADQLRGAFGNNADQDSYLANAIRFNETMKDVKATTLDVASGGLRDIRTELQAGKSAWDAMGTAGVNALGKIIDKLADKTLDTYISKLFGGLLGSGTGGINADGSIAGAIGGTSVGGAPLVGGLFAEGGYTGPGAKYDVAGYVHAGEYVFDQVATNRIGVGNLARLHRGYADGGLVGGPAPWGGSTAAPVAAGGNSGGGLRVHVTTGTTVDDDGKLRSMVKNVSVQSFNEGLTDYVGSPTFVQHVGAASKQAQIWRVGT